MCVHTVDGYDLEIAVLALKFPMDGFYVVLRRTFIFTPEITLQHLKKVEALTGSVCETIYGGVSLEAMDAANDGILSDVTGAVILAVTGAVTVDVTGGVTEAVTGAVTGGGAGAGAKTGSRVTAGTSTEYKSWGRHWSSSCSSSYSSAVVHVPFRLGLDDQAWQKKKFEERV